MENPSDFWHIQYADNSIGLNSRNPEGEEYSLSLALISIRPHKALIKYVSSIATKIITLMIKIV